MPATLDRKTRLRSERDFHDRQAAARAHDVYPPQPAFADADYLEHACWIRPAFDRLGDVCGRKVLDLGCGHGMAAVVLARRGADVTACDLSVGYLREARARARANGVTIRFGQIDAERLPFADGSFDRIWGSAILHHLDLCRAGAELARVLRPGGIAVCCEPWGENRWLRWARQHAPYPGKQRTPDEEPLGRRHLAELHRHFSKVDVTGYQLLSMASRIVGDRRLVNTLRRWDSALLERWPHWQRYCRYVVLACYNAITA